MRAITDEFGSMDAFVVSDMPQSSIDRLSGTGRSGLKVVGVATAAEYLKNVGVAVGKPDTHLRRLLGPDRLPLASGEKEVIAVIDRIVKEIGQSATYVDNHLWMFCAKYYGEICTEKRPKCNGCLLRVACNQGQRK